MRCLGALMFFLALAHAGAAAAGAWLREQGSGFGELSTTVGPFDPMLKLYLEYGWRPDLTFGFELETLPDADIGKANVFAVRPLGRTDGTWRASWMLGGGLAWSPLLMEPTLKGGVSLGRGLEWDGHYGWAAFDFSVEYLNYTRVTITKLDSTVGMGLTDRTRGMLQLFLTDFDGAFIAKLAPSLLYQPRKDGVTLQFGLEIPNAGVEDAALKIGLWKEF